MTRLLYLSADAAVSPDPYFSPGALLIGIPLIAGLAVGAVIGLVFLVRHKNKKNAAQGDYRGIPYGAPETDPPDQDHNADHKS